MMPDDLAPPAATVMKRRTPAASSPRSTIRNVDGRRIEIINQLAKTHEIRLKQAVALRYVRVRRGKRYAKLKIGKQPHRGGGTAAPLQLRLMARNASHNAAAADQRVAVAAGERRRQRFARAEIGQTR
jgi:hypothetical protein